MKKLTALFEYNFSFIFKAKESSPENKFKSVCKGLAPNCKIIQDIGFGEHIGEIFLSHKA